MMFAQSAVLFCLIAGPILFAWHFLDKALQKKHERDYFGRTWIEFHKQNKQHKRRHKWH